MKNNIHSLIETGSPATCPFCNPDRRQCLASTSGLVPDLQRRIKYCLSEDFDDCPFFLFRCLRTSPAKNYSRHIEGARRVSDYTGRSENLEACSRLMDSPTAS